MCYVLYSLALAIALYFSDHLLEQYALSVMSENNQAMTVALGWEIVLELWPVFLLALVFGSMLTFFTLRLKQKKPR